MEIRVERVQLERFEAVVFDRGAERWAIVMPGAGYCVQAPLRCTRVMPPWKPGATTWW